METRRGRKIQNTCRSNRNPVNGHRYEEPTKSASSESSEGEIEFEGWVEFVTKKDGGGGNGRNEKSVKRKVTNGMIDMKKNSNKYGIYNEYGKNIDNGKYKRNNHKKDIQYIDTNGKYYRQTTTPMVHVHKTPQMIVNTIPPLESNQVQHIQHHTTPNYLIQHEIPQIKNHQTLQMIPSHIKKDTFTIEQSNPIYVNPVHPSIIKNQQTLPQVYIRQPPTVIISNQPRPPLIINPPPANVILKNQSPQPIYVNHSRPNVIIKNEPATMNYPTNMDSVPIQLEHPQQFPMPPKIMGNQNETIYSHNIPSQQIHVQTNGKNVMHKIETNTAPPMENHNNTVSFITPNGNGSNIQNDFMPYTNTFEIQTHNPSHNVIMMNPNDTYHQQHHHIQNGTMQPQIVSMNDMDRSFMMPTETTHNEMFVNEGYQFPHQTVTMQQPIHIENMPTMMQMNPRGEYVTQEIVMVPPPMEEYTTMPIPLSYEQPFHHTMQEIPLRNTQNTIFQNTQPMISQVVQQSPMIQQPQVVQQSQVVQQQQPQMIQQIGSPLRYTQTFATPTKVNMNMTPSRITQIQPTPPMNQVQVRNTNPMNYVVGNPNTQCVQTMNQTSPNRNVLCTPLRRNYTTNVNANRINNNLVPKVQIIAKPVNYRNTNNATCR